MFDNRVWYSFKNSKGYIILSVMFLVVWLNAPNRYQLRKKSTVFLFSEQILPHKGFGSLFASKGVWEGSSADRSAFLAFSQWVSAGGDTGGSQQRLLGWINRWDTDTRNLTWSLCRWVTACARLHRMMTILPPFNVNQVRPPVSPHLPTSPSPHHQPIQLRSR